MYGIALLIVAVICLSRVLAFFQVKKINEQLSAIKKTAPVSSTGLQKSWRGSQVYVLTADSDGTIIAGYYTHGMTVFSAFQRDESLEETHYKDIIEKLAKKSKLTRLESAKLSAAKYLEEGFLK